MKRFQSKVKANYEIAHKKQLRELAPECMVLLKKNQDLPLEKPETIALYGSGARRTMKGGTGSGDVNIREFLSIEQALEAGGFSVSTKTWLDAYDEIKVKAHESFVEEIKQQASEKKIPAFFAGMGAVMPEPEYNLPLDGEGGTAIYVLARVSGEGGDRKDIPGDFRLTDTEIRDILALNRKYNKFLFVLNVGGVLDLSDVMEVENILLISQLGMVTGEAFVDVLLGKANPSGKLSSTWAKISEFNQIEEFGHPDDTRYTEGIYVGYRYFNTVKKNPLFPFGYGKSFTEFQIQCVDFFVLRDFIHVDIAVTNLGTYTGKEVVQLYYSAPRGVIERPCQELLAFQKTSEIRPEEQERLQILIPISKMACYDENKGAWVVEPGSYTISAGTDSGNTFVCGKVDIPDLIIVEKVKQIDGTVASRKQKSGIGRINNSTVDLDYLTDEQLVQICVGKYKEAAGMESIIGNAASAVAGAAGETADILREKGFGALIMADGPAGLRLSSVYRLQQDGAVGYGMGSMAMYMDFFENDIKQMLQKKLAEADAAFTEENTYYQYCSAIPIGTALAQSWNEELVRACGALVAEEMKLFGVHLWLAPALNIHRSPLCGRNFEYYSEDPYLSGKLAAAMVQGVQSHPGCGVTIKHFACNNQETNRFHSNSIVGERALREIYLKGFEIAVKEAKPYALMTSYNLLNGVHTCNRRDLLNDILRDEWGFEGIVMTDWLVTGSGFFHDTKYPSASAAGCIYAGNDLIMPGSKKDEDEILAALKGEDKLYPITIEEVRSCAERIICVMNKLTAKEKEK